MTTPNTPQPPPLPGKLVIADLVRADIEERVVMGLDKYGTLLRAHNGRDALMDSYQEALDLMFYLRQAIAERDGR